jgi:hypothetical protein
MVTSSIARSQGKTMEKNNMTGLVRHLVSNTTRARQIASTAALVIVYAIPSLGAGQPVAAPNPPTAPCAGDKGTLLFTDPICTNPIQSRYGDDERDGTKMKNPYAVYTCNTVSKVTFTEKERKSRIQSDLKAVFDSLKKGGVAVASPACDSTPKTYQLKYGRGTLDVKAVNDKGEELQSNTVITGPVEHWFLGLDLPVTSQKTLKYDSATQTLKPREKDAQFYLSLNYLLGDVLADMGDDSNWGKWKEHISIKLFVRASSRPFDSAGVGLGFKLPDFRSEKVDLGLSALSLYGGYFWTKQDELKDGAPDLNGGRDAQWRVGVTFDLESMIKAVKW